MLREHILKNKALLLSLVLGALVLLSSMAGMKALASLKKTPEEAANGESALQVRTVVVTPETASITLTGYGDVSALTAVPIASEVPGRIEKIHPRLEAGEIIPAGELLFEIDSSDYAAALREAEAAVEQWEHTIRKLEK